MTTEIETQPDIDGALEEAYQELHKAEAEGRGADVAELNGYVAYLEELIYDAAGEDIDPCGVSHGINV